MEVLQYFTDQPFNAALKTFFQNLQVPVNVLEEKPARPQDVLGEFYNLKKDGIELLDDVYVFGMVEEAAFTHSKSAFESGEDVAKIRKDYDGLLIFGVTLKKRKDGLLPNRTQLAEVTRAFNRAFPYMPVTVVFYYDQFISIANAERQAFKRESKEGEKVGKVSLLKDVHTLDTHRGHLDILTELTIPTSGSKAVINFSQLYAHWQKVLSTQTLNKRFYQELFHWYLWAKRHIEIPTPPKSETQDKDTLTSIFTIRLLTRLLFVWFVKEKKLIPKEAFDDDYISNVLKKFDPDGALQAMGKRSEGSYYKAILQNLFFATLNTPMDKDPASRDERRQFIDESKGKSGYNDQHLDQTKYRHKDLFKDEKVILKLFKDVPFLNGGLFECLDYKNDDGSDRRYDGFSVTKNKQALVPDVLFFSPASEEDLSADFENDKKMTRVRIRGLIRIFDSYKFTIAENTPVEEEIALDPELLGKVFENLLASYNPETKTTARKQTGSFYTPREIVNYMVDESLKAYLLQKLEEIPEAYVEVGKKQPDMFGNNHRKGQLKIETPVVANDDEKINRLQQSLEKIFDDAHHENVFSAQECEVLIEAISNCRIVDPACGSGAYPMGILHRMVTLLARLDPNNKAWKEAQLKRAEADLKRARTMEDATIRGTSIAQAEKRIEYIKESFSNPKHEFDYTRKVFLIENCIYGIDIQQIAVQIAKLRFFISLMSEQQVDDNRPNRNILSMPNLETKFVAANTLIALEQVNSTLESKQVRQVEKELKELRRQIFFTRSYREKKKLKQEERKLRQKLKAALEISGFGEKSAEQAAEWDPFDQLHSAPFFDIETMFGFTQGYNIVIGNPPYGHTINENKNYFSKNYISAEGKHEIFKYFIEKGLTLLCENGILSYITSDTWTSLGYFKKLRKLIYTAYCIRAVSKSLYNVFETATVDTNIYFIEKSKPSKKYLLIEGDLKSKEERFFEMNDDYVFNLKDENTIIKKIEKSSKQLDDYCEIWQGLIAYGTKEQLREYTSDTKESKYHRKLLYGGDISKFNITWSGEYLKYGEWLHRPRPSYIFDREKILVQRIRNPQLKTRLVCAIDEFGFINGTGSSNILLKEDVKQPSLKYIASLLNSSLINYWFSYYFIDVNIKPEQLRKIPIRLPSFEKYFVLVVEYIQYLKTTKLDSSFFERLIDTMVYEVYLPEEIKAGGAEVLRHFSNLPELGHEDDEKNLQTIEKVYKDLSSPKHPISAALLKLLTIEEINIIEGRK